MYRKLRIGLGLLVLVWGQAVIAQPGSRLTRQPKGALRDLSIKAEKLMTDGAYQSAYNTYLQLMSAYQQRKDQAGTLENVDKILELHKQKKITLAIATLTKYYTIRQDACKALNLKIPPKHYLNIAETYAKAGQMKQALYYAEKGLRLSNNAETADLLKTFLNNVHIDRGMSRRAAYSLETKLHAVQKELLRKENALGRLKRQNSLLKRQVLDQASEMEKLDQGLKSQVAITKNGQRVNKELEEANNTRQWWNIVLLFLALAGLVVAGYSAARLYFNIRKHRRVKQELIQKRDDLMTSEAKLADAEDTIRSQTDELQDKKYTIQRHLSEIDGRKEELVELTEQTFAQKKQLEEMKASKVQLAESIAQDLKKPLNTILRSQDLMAIQGAGGQMKKYTEEMLAIQQYLNHQLEIKQGDFNFYQMIQTTIEPWLEQAQKKGIEVTNDVPTQYWGLFDKGMVSRVVEKLFCKAIQHTITGGQVTITGKPIPEEQTDTTLVTAGMELSIADNGASILHDEFQKVFKPFMELDARSFADKGIAGIDLTFCKVALEAHQTAMKVTSKTGKGTTFTFQMPLGTPQHMI